MFPPSPVPWRRANASPFISRYRISLRLRLPPRLLSGDYHSDIVGSSISDATRHAGAADLDERNDYDLTVGDVIILSTGNERFILLVKSVVSPQ